MLANDELLEWDVYCDNYYGTPKKYIEDSMEQGLDVILEITVEGALNIKEKYPDSVLVFVLPPSFEELKNRIVGRGTEKSDIIEKRLCEAKKELLFVDRYDYVVVNDDVNKAVNDISSILMAEKHRFTRNADILKQLGI
jgi:guanylate kinase